MPRGAVEDTRDHDGQNLIPIGDPSCWAYDTIGALLPLNLVSSWAVFEPGISMDPRYGTGNWLRCRMTATDWAYLSPDPCAHLPGSNAAFPYLQPLSLLTSTDDNGAYLGSVGAPHAPAPEVTLFGQTPATYVEGPDHPWTLESWQL
ncbi:MAG: hypothetical protein ACI91B_000303, partial [Planctomycetota bacterium]